jgi:hypothetical protein
LLKFASHLVEVVSEDVDDPVEKLSDEEGLDLELDVGDEEHAVALLHRVWSRLAVGACVLGRGVAKE